MIPSLDLPVLPPSGGERLDRFLAAAQTDLSRNRIQGLIRAGQVRVNGRVARASLRLKGGDRFEVNLPDPASLPGSGATRLTPEPIPLTIVYEDDSILVLDKPAGLVVHPGAGAEGGTLAHALLYHCPAIEGVGGPGRPGIVHRLDKGTSGLMVVAKTGRSYRGLVEALRARTVRRVYRALVWGSPAAEDGVVESRIGRDPRSRKRMAVVQAPAGRPARSRWRVRRRFGPVTEIEVSLDTGRTHQIRVHLAHLRHPVVGDPVYGGRPKKLLSLREAERSLAAVLLDLLPRQALHATELELNHPVTGARLRFQSPVPPDLARALELIQAWTERSRG